MIVAGTRGEVVNLKMRRHIVTQIALRATAVLGVLLPNDDLIKLLDQVFGKAGFDFQVSQAVFIGVGLRHACIGTDFCALCMHTTIN
jgi:hypothetical protein